jgi:hypothetical protein
MRARLLIKGGRWLRWLKVVRWIGASRPVISALLVASGHSVCKFKTRQQQMNDAIWSCSALLMKIFIQVKLLSSLTCTHNTPKESRLRDILRLKSRFLVNHTSRVHILRAVCVHGRPSLMQTGSFIFCSASVWGVCVCVLSRRRCEFLQRHNISLTEVSGSGK